MCVGAKLLQSCPTLFDPMDHDPPGPSVHGILQEEYWSVLPFPPPGDLPNLGITPTSLAFLVWSGRVFTTEPPGSAYTLRNPISG